MGQTVPPHLSRRSQRSRRVTPIATRKRTRGKQAKRSQTKRTGTSVDPSPAIDRDLVIGGEQTPRRKREKIPRIHRARKIRGARRTRRMIDLMTRRKRRTTKEEEMIRRMLRARGKRMTERSATGQMTRKTKRKRRRKRRKRRRKRSRTRRKRRKRRQRKRKNKRMRN